MAMRASLSAKQTLGVTALIALSMMVLSAQHIANLARAGLEDTRGHGELLSRVIYQRTRDAIGAAPDPYDALREDDSIRSILESTATYGKNVTYAAIVDSQGIAIVHSFPSRQGQRLEPGESLAGVLDAHTAAQIRAIYADRTLEIVQPLQLGDVPFGSIRIGMSPIFIRDDLSSALRPMLWTTTLITAAAILLGLVLARRVLRPIHVISSGLLRLQRGETDVIIDLPAEEELKGVGESLKAISEQLAARSQSGVDGPVEYARKLGALGRLMAGLAHEVKNPLNAMTIHLELVRQHLLRASAHKAAYAARAHAPAGGLLGISGAALAEDPPPKAADGAPLVVEIDGASEHVDVIAGEIKRLDDVIQNFLRFIRPQEVRLERVDARVLIDEVLALVGPDAQRTGIACKADYAGAAPLLQADEALLRQALLNLALNGCQAMPNGGILTVGARTAPDGRAMLTVADTGIGIPADRLEHIFDLYYTTRPGGSGIGLSMVYRIVQLHGGEIEVESTVDRGTSFRVLFPRTP
jgi:signal transduction histidine kinase